MLIIKLAFRNIIGAGLRTWLNVIVLSIAFVAIIWMQGLINGMSEHIMKDMINMEFGGGQFHQKNYDPFDPLTIEDSHAPLTTPFIDLINRGQATPILITSGAIFLEGRVQTIFIKGIDPLQEIIAIPSDTLKSDDPHVIPGLIGTWMAKQTNLKIGDFVTARWRDVHGTFDAADIQIVQIMNTNVPTVDNGQIWIPLNKMREMLQSPSEATLIVLNKNIESVPSEDTTWIYRDKNYLLKDIIEMVRTKSIGNSIFYILLLAMALVAIFDTQVFSVFRRRKEMGTLMALGMYRGQIIGLFTLEGALHGIMALLVGAIYGIPLLLFSAKTGLPVPEASRDMGVAMPSALYPSYGLGLMIGTTLLVFITVTIVSFLPTRKISRLKPTDALRGKMS